MSINIELIEELREELSLDFKELVDIGDDIKGEFEVVDFAVLRTEQGLVRLPLTVKREQ